MSTSHSHTERHKRITYGGLLVSLGIIYGDIGTSPLYVMTAIVGKQVISERLILGGLSCIFWTLTLQTTIKYVLLTLRADNKGEGGIFSLYTLVRKKSTLFMVPAVLGGAALLADGIITPPISVSSAIEGLSLKYPGIPTVPIVISILTILFMVQQLGTNLVGKFFGPLMFIWFSMLAILGIMHLSDDFSILKALNPYYGYSLLVENPGGFWILGAVFLCTTGAEALYSDLGHCGRANIRISWIFVKTCLLLNYFGQGAWLLTQNGTVLGEQRPFFSLMPPWFLEIGIVIATIAAIIASQALISGSFTLISEAMRLNFWPKVRIAYPTILKGQIYVPSANRMLWAGCIGVVLYFRESSNMEAAYGLSITITMMMTTFLLAAYLRARNVSLSVVGLLLTVFISIEVSFLSANLLKFTHGGWVSLVIAGILVLAMASWYLARKIRNRFLEFVKLEDYYDVLHELSNDQSVPKYATHLVYLTSANNHNEIEWKVIYSVLYKQPKRADVYWFVHVDVTDEPYTLEYKVDVLVPDDVLRIEFRLGFRVEPRINLFFRKVVMKLVEEGTVDISSRYASLNVFNILGDFRFIVLERVLSYENQLSFFERMIMDMYDIMKHLTLSEEKAFGLDTSAVTVERVPLLISPIKDLELERVY